MQRWRPLLTALVIAAASLTPALAQEASNPAPRGAMGILIRNPDTSRGEPPFAIADQFGKVQRLVEPSPGVSLDRFVGERIRIKHDTGRTLLASQLELPTATSSRSEPRVQLSSVSHAQFIPPRRVREIESPRSFGVIPTQATEDGGEAIDLDKVLADEARRGETLPEPVRGDSIEPLPADDYYPEGQYHESSPEVIDMGIVSPRRRSPLLHQEPGPPLPLGGYGRDSGCVTCNPPSQRGFYARADYLLWWFDGMATPPLATTNDLGNPPILGDAGTRVVYGGEILDDARNGAQFTIGAWLDDRRDLAIEGDWMFFGNENDAFSYSDPTASGVFGRPFYNTATDAQDVQIISQPGAAAGSFSVAARSEFESFGLRARTGVGCHELGGGGGCSCPTCTSGRGPLSGALGGMRQPAPAISRIDFIAGYRYLNLEESLAFSENVAPVTPPISRFLNESFNASNEFHGADLGYVYDLRSKRWNLELTGKVAVGGTRQRVGVNGTTSIGGTTTTGGLLTPAGQVGYYSRDRFSVVPELSARASYRLTDQLSVSAAYSLLYWANVVRPGDVIDPTSPTFDWQETSLWAHGLNFGLDYNY
ncbi:BBP7 family outer membrane beta-barrel protein [Botrimarina mediterranea]|uniref:BBP7 family outer membrane beta-barrel protein n=1 Tax=Botrimarina mediterranea TaxID=2528022 RepID=UPI00118ABA50|nr:hypothetical protein K2D_46260 [Planctomycetes bacterium K2D]